MEGVARAKTEGKYKGRPARINVAHIREMKSNGASVNDSCSELGVSRSSVYRLLGKS